MSRAEIERFVADLKGNPELLEQLKAGATGLATIVEQAQAKGYDITVDEAKDYIREQAKHDLTDEQLDSVAGGKQHQSPTVETTVQVQGGGMPTTVYSPSPDVAAQIESISVIVTT